MHTSFLAVFSFLGVAAGFRSRGGGFFSASPSSSASSSSILRLRVGGFFLGTTDSVSSVSAPPSSVMVSAAAAATTLGFSLGATVATGGLSVSGSSSVAGTRAARRLTLGLGLSDTTADAGGGIGCVGPGTGGVIWFLGLPLPAGDAADLGLAGGLAKSAVVAAATGFMSMSPSKLSRADGLEADVTLGAAFTGLGSTFSSLPDLGATGGGTGGATTTCAVGSFSSLPDLTSAAGAVLAFSLPVSMGTSATGAPLVADGAGSGGSLEVGAGAGGASFTSSLRRASS